MSHRAPRRVGHGRIQESAARQVSFSKRRQGLFKKIAELSTLCGTQSVVLIKSPAGRIYSIGEPDVESVIDRFLNDRPAGGLILADVEGRRRNEEAKFRSHLQCDVWLETADVKVGEQKQHLQYLSGRMTQRWGSSVNDLETSEIDQMVYGLLNLLQRMKNEGTSTETAEAGRRNLYGGVVSFPEFSSTTASSIAEVVTQAIGSSSHYHSRLLQTMEDLSQGGGLGGGGNTSQQNVLGFNFQGFGDSSQGSQMPGMQDFGIMWPGQSSSSTAPVRNSVGMGDGGFSDYQPPNLQPSFSDLRRLHAPISPSSAPSWDSGGMGDARFSDYQPQLQPSFSDLAPLPASLSPSSAPLWNSGDMGDGSLPDYQPAPPNFPSLPPPE